MIKKSGLQRDLASRYHETIPAIIGLPVGPTAWLEGEWVTVDGFNTVALTLKNDGFTNSQVNLQWSHDKVSVEGMDYAVVPSDANNLKTGETGVKAQYVRVQLYNGDSVSHVMTCYALLKV